LPKPKLIPCDKSIYPPSPSELASVNQPSNSDLTPPFRPFHIPSHIMSLGISPLTFPKSTPNFFNIALTNLPVLPTYDITSSNVSATFLVPATTVSLPFLVASAAVFAVFLAATLEPATPTRFKSSKTPPPETPQALLLMLLPIASMPPSPCFL